MPKSSYGVIDFLKRRTKTYFNEKKSKKITIKGILRLLFMKPPFIGESVFIILLLTAWLWTLITTPSLMDLGTMSVSLLTDNQIKEYKVNMVKSIVSELESRGLSLSNLKLSEKIIENIATVNFLKTAGEENKLGKNLVYLNDKSGRINFSKNTTDSYYYLDNFGNSKQINYSSAYIQATRSTSRWKAPQLELMKKNGVKRGQIFNRSDLHNYCFEVIKNEEGRDITGEYLQLQISNILDPFLIKSNLLTYLYTSTNNSKLCDNFVKNEKLNSEIILEKKDATVESCGTADDIVINEIFEISGIDVHDFNAFISFLRLEHYVAEGGKIYKAKDKDGNVIDKDGNVIDEDGNVIGKEDRNLYGISYSPSSISNDSIIDYLTKTEEGKRSDLTLKAFKENDFKEKTILEINNDTYTVYTGKLVRYFTYCESSMPIYFVKEAKTWFGNFKFENKITQHGPRLTYVVPREIDKPFDKSDYGDVNGIDIESICNFSVNEEAKKEFLKLFNGQDGSSLSDISIFAEQLKQAAIENNDYNLQLSYYGLCKMMEDVDGINLILDEEIKNKIEKNGNLEINTIPSYVYNVLISSARIPNFGFGDDNSYIYVTNGAYLSPDLFNEYTMPYGSNYKTKFPTRALNFFSDLNVPSGLTLEEFYKVAEYYAGIRRSHYLQHPKYRNIISVEDNMRFCYELAEAAYYIEQDIGINGLFILGQSAFEGGWGASKYSIEDYNLWGFGIMTSGNVEENYKDYKFEKDIKLNERYIYPHQKCAYEVAVYIKCLYLTNPDDVNKYINKLPNKSCADLKEISDKDFENFLTENEIDANIEKIFRIYRNWTHGLAHDDPIGRSYSCYSPTMYSIDGIYNRGWRYESKDYILGIYSCMGMMYKNVFP